jgi:hypothetical protein
VHVEVLLVVVGVEELLADLGDALAHGDAAHAEDILAAQLAALALVAEEVGDAQRRPPVSPLGA